MTDSKNRDGYAKPVIYFGPTSPVFQSTRNYFATPNRFCHEYAMKNSHGSERNKTNANTGTGATTKSSEVDFMTQRQIKFGDPAPTVCKTCERPPHGYEWLGIYFIECSLCGQKTPHMPTLADAVAAWNRGQRHAIKVTAA
jgi:hypothetical protein